ncbi:MAG: hypothetical protein ACYDBP_08400 [Leptospirales bacterium]
MKKQHGKISGVMAGLGLWIVSILSGALSEAPIASADTLKEGTQVKKEGSSVVGGIVLAVHQRTGSRNISLVIRETRTDRNGEPVCQAPTGRILTVESIGGIFLSDKARLKSSMIVMESPGDITPRNLVPGECVTVAPDDIDLKESRLHSSIRIDDGSLTTTKTDEFRKGLVELWARTLPAKGAVPFN